MTIALMVKNVYGVLIKNNMKTRNDQWPINLAFITFIIISLSFLMAICIGGIIDVRNTEQKLSEYIGCKYLEHNIVAFEYPNKLLLNNGEWIDYRIINK